MIVYYKLFYNFAVLIAQVAELVDLSADRQARFLNLIDICITFMQYQVRLRITIM